MSIRKLFQYRLGENPHYKKTISEYCFLWGQMLVVAICLQFACAKYAQAAVGPGCPAVYYMTPPASININPTVAVGTVIGTSSLSWGMTPTCNFSESSAIVWDITGVGIPNGNLYPTGIAGISYRVHFNFDDTTWNDWFPITRNQYSSSATTLQPGSLTMQLVKTGPIMGGTFPAQDIARMTSQASGYTPIYFRLSSPIIVQPVSPSCTATSVVPVALLPANKSSLLKMGDTVGDKNFNLSVTCLTATNISLAFSGNVVDTTNAVFKNTDATTGSSVGIQILRNNNAVPLGTGNYIGLGVVNGNITPQFTARYYALNSSVVEGNVSSVAFATIVYN